MSGRAPRDIASELGDFSATPRLLLIAVFAIAVGVVSAFVAKGLLALIGFFTNLFFFQRLSTALVTPEGSGLGPWVILVPVAGALIIGVMARYGSDRIRGHGIPEAIEAILIHGSRVEPKVALLKPLSSAISIGSGGPFGAEGPIIMTGGAVGSLIAQFLHLTSAERKTLLVAGAAAGMSATFAAPMASVLLAVELLLFEWKPRSLIPVALASVTAAVVRRYVIGPGPLFPVAPHPAFIGPVGVLGCVLAGLLAGALSVMLTQAVYAAEDAFEHVPIHWMWWPAIGGLVIGIGGWLFPPALGVGYDIIGRLLQADNVGGRLILGILIVKSIIWSVSLGSGTSGGVLAPLLMIGGALGGIESWFLPGEGAGFWPLVSMGAVLGGTMRSPFTAVIFAVELTHDVNMLLPLLVAATIAHGFTVLVLKRSILTEKIARRGYHVSREYAIDPLEILFVREVMRTSVVALPASAPYHVVHHSLGDSIRRRQRLYPVVDEEQTLVGVVTGGDLQSLALTTEPPPDQPLAAILKREVTVAFPDESLRMIAYRMAETGLTEFPVVDRGRRIVGMIGLAEFAQARALNLDAEQRRERVFSARIAMPFGGSGREMHQWPDVRPGLRLLHYWWPVVMGASIAAVVHRATARPVDVDGLALLLCGILAAYSLDRILDGPDMTRPTWLKPTLQTAAAGAIGAGVVLLPRVPIRAGMLVPVLGVLVLVYPRLKSVPLLKTLLVSAVWTWSSIALPFHDGSWLGWRAWMVPVAIPLTLIIASGCLLCDLKDITADRESSVSSLPVLVGIQHTVTVAVALAAIGAGVAAVERRWGLSTGGVVLGLAAMYPGLLARDTIGPLMVDMILTIPGLLVTFHVV